MTSPALPASVAASSPYEKWLQYFLRNRDAPWGVPWHSPDRLSSGERQAVSRSIQQFQLGEWARGRGLKRRAGSHPCFASDPWFLPALDLFIAEEQGHSAALGRFLDHERIPHLAAHWVDGIFRRLRKLAGLELCIVVLVTAEVLAMPFYKALRHATHSPLLRAICARVLRDEKAHLNYQALTIGLIRRRLPDWVRALHCLRDSVLFHGTALVLWQQHRCVFQAAGWSFRTFWNEARHWFHFLQFRVERA
jgi:hypothetical protein